MDYDKQAFTNQVRVYFNLASTSSQEKGREDEAVQPT